MDILIRLVIVIWFIQFITQLIICKSCELKIEMVIDNFQVKLIYLKQIVEEILWKDFEGREQACMCIHKALQMWKSLFAT